MDIHKPKPFHNWREFLKEYGIIVLGVLTALGLEQAIESWHGREKVEVVRSSIKEEMRFNLAKADLLAQMQDCSYRQIEAIAGAIGRNDQAGLRQLLAQDALPAATSWNDAAWRAAISSGISDRLDENERRYLPVAYEVVAILKDAQQRSVGSLNRLGLVAQKELSGSSAAPAAELSEFTQMASALRDLQRAGSALDLLGKGKLDLEFTPEDQAQVPWQEQVGKCKAAAAALGPAAKD